MNIDANGNNFRLPDMDFKRVLVPVDFSASTLETLRYATALAKKFGAVVDVLHVIQPIMSRHDDAESRHSLLQAMKEGAGGELRRLVGLLRIGESVELISARIREGCADEVIISEASSSNASLIIMGTRPRSWLSGLFRRHTVKQVIRHSPCPVMVLRSGMKVSRANRQANRFPVSVLQAF